MLGVGALARSTNMGFAGAAMGVGINIAAERAMGGPNDTMAKAVGRGAFWFAAESLVRGASLYPVLAMGAQAAYSAYDDHEKYGKGKIQKYYRAGFGGNFQDNQQSATMRQRGVEQMQQSKMNARNVLGSEARTFHESYGTNY